jgi:hypothetical protein
MRGVQLVSRVIVPALAVSAVGVALGSVSCAATPTPIPVRSFNRPGKVAFMCLDVNTPAMDGTQRPVPLTAPESQCPPVANAVIGQNLEFHYYGLVTQQSTGELAVVDLTAGGIVDEDVSTPGTNFIPVGANPTDVVVAPVAEVGASAFTYVSSGDVNSFALYAIPNARMLGDSTGTTRLPPLRLTDLVACTLPQRPIALALLPNVAGSSSGTDSGATTEDAGVDATAPASSSCQKPGYAVAVLMQAWAGQPAEVMVVDPTPLACGTPSRTLPTCMAIGATGAFASSLAGATLGPGVPWPDGVPYADGGSTSAAGSMQLTQEAGAAMAEASAPAVVDAGTDEDADLDAELSEDADLDAEGPANATLDAGAAEAASPPPGGNGAATLSVGPVFDPNPTFMVARDDAPVLYVADGAVPLIHVIDVSNPTAPVEVSSYVATSQVQPTRRVQIGALALSPPTSSFDPVTGRAIRYLYAIDSNDGTLMVFDATNPIPPRFTPPLERPHGELNPFAPIDRLSFSAPVAAVSFVQHDWPLFPPNTNGLVGYTGLICNPNPNTRVSGTSTIPPNTPANYGAYYATDQAAVIEPQGSGTESFPGRLRGIFGFVTLSNGNLVAIDVDDWDAPCRRPDPMDPLHQVGLLSLPQPPPMPVTTDIDPYHAPVAHFVGGSVAYTTQETFFPVSAPNRMRSNYLLRNDPTSGNHEPYMPGPPQLLSSAGAPVAGVGQSQSILLPTALPDGFVDPAYYATPTDPNDNYGSISTPLASADAEALSLDAGSALFPGASSAAAVRISLDDPTAHMDQDWTVTYEGALPQVSPFVVNMGTNDGYQSVILTAGGSAPDGGVSNGPFCALGIEDWTQGQIRANAALGEMARLGLPIPPLDPSVQLPQWTADYIEIVDDLLGQDDPYWNTGGTPPDGGPGGYDCWNGTGVEAPEKSFDRYNLCVQTYGQLGENADSYLARDFPIAEAYDGSLIIGRFGFPGNTQGEQTNNRTVVGPDPSNVLFLKPAACCFHHQANVKIRTGGEWVTLGQNGLGLLHHVLPDPATGRCVQSNVPHDQLLNARAFDVPFFDESNGCASPLTTPPSIERTDLLAMRNPMFSYVMWGGCTPLGMFQHTSTARDLNWHVSLRGGFQPLTIQLGGGTLLPIVPQAMAFAPAFQQLAIVDGSYQGLIMIDLSSLTFAHNPYF